MALAERAPTRSRRMWYRVNRPRHTRRFAAVFIVFYLFMVWLRPATGTGQDEIFPFFSWALFAQTPAWQRLENTVVLRAIDGEPMEDVRYLIPNDDIRDAKALRRTVDACESDRTACEAAVEAWLFPVVRRLTSGGSVEFSIVKVRVDLRVARQEISRLADGAARETDFFQPQDEVGRWTVRR